MLALKAVEPDVISHSRIKEFDVLKYGSSIALLGSMTMYRQQKTVQVATSSQPWGDFLPTLEHVDDTYPDTHRISNLVLVYEGVQCALENLFDRLVDAFAVSKVLICAGQFGDNAFAVYVKKACYRQLPSLEICSVEPTLYKLPVSGKSTLVIKSMLVGFNKCMNNTVSNMYVCNAYGSYSFEQYIDNARALSSVELMTLKGQCEAVQWKQRTEFQSTFLRVLFSLSKVIELEKQ